MFKTSIARATGEKQEGDRKLSHQRISQLRYPERNRARRAVHAAVKCGKLPRPTTLTCMICGAPSHEYHHHEGYDKSHWLDVVPVCRSCHGKVETNRPAPSFRTKHIPSQLQGGIVAHLIRLQNTMALPDDRFAEYIGVAPGEWRFIRTGRGTFGRIRARAVCKRIPECVVYVEVPERHRGTLVGRLIKQQALMGMDDSEFAARLGITRSTWNKVCSGIYRVGPKLVRGARSMFPELFDMEEVLK